MSSSVAFSNSHTLHPLKKESLWGKTKHTGQLSFLYHTTEPSLPAAAPLNPTKTRGTRPRAAATPPAARSGITPLGPRGPPPKDKAARLPGRPCRGPSPRSSRGGTSRGRGTSARGSAAGLHSPCPTLLPGRAALPPPPSPDDGGGGWGGGEGRRTRCAGRPRPLQASGESPERAPACHGGAGDALPRPGPEETSRPPLDGSGGAVSYLRAARGTAGPGRAWRRAWRRAGGGGWCKGGKGRGDAAGYLRPPAATAIEGEPMSQRQEPRRCGPAPSRRPPPPAPSPPTMASQQAPRRHPRTRVTSSSGQRGGHVNK